MDVRYTEKHLSSRDSRRLTSTDLKPLEESGVEVCLAQEEDFLIR